MLDTRFPRILGDLGNPQTWPFEVLYDVVADADPEAIVRGDAAAMTDAFIAAGQRLIERGAVALTTSCGFLCLIQAQLQAALPVPVLASALNQGPLITSMLPAGQHLTVLTIAAENLSPAHLTAAGLSTSTIIAGMDPEGPFAGAILNNRANLDIAACRSEMIHRSQEIISHHPATGGLLLECTNMAPHAADIQRAVKKPVFSITSAIEWLRLGLTPPTF